MGRRGRKAEKYEALREPTAAREDLERRWRSRLAREDSLARLVTADDARIEPFHRWLAFRQSFSPGLVRRFLSEIDTAEPSAATAPILDPFSGTGTTVVECARAEVPAIGLEASPALTFIANAKAERAFPTWELPTAETEWRELAPRLTHELHRAALLLAVARQHSTGGRSHAAAPPLAQALAHVEAMIRDDLRRPLRRRNRVERGDARTAHSLADGSVRAILTSPPYLSRYDYAEIATPLEEVYRFWYPESVSRETSREANAGAQLPASMGYGYAEPRSSGQSPHRGVSNGDDEVPEPAAVAEVGRVLAESGQRKLGIVVSVYFRDLRSVLRQCSRVLRDGSTAWFVIGGARWKGVYIPSDLILAELAEEEGFSVDRVFVARDLIHARRKLGSTGHVAPRESIVVMTKP